MRKKTIYDNLSTVWLEVARMKGAMEIINIPTRTYQWESIFDMMNMDFGVKLAGDVTSGGDFFCTFPARPNDTRYADVLYFFNNYLKIIISLPCVDKEGLLVVSLRSLEKKYMLASRVQFIPIMVTPMIKER